MKSINCPNCRNKLNEGALFCGACGYKIIQQSEVINVEANSCPKCNREFEKDENFCAECGTSKGKNVIENKQTSQKGIILKSKPQPISTIKSNSSRKKKKGGILKTIAKIVIGFIAFIIVGSIILYNLDDNVEDASISQEEIVDFQNNTNENSTEREEILNTNENSTEIEGILDTNDKNIADKYRNGVGVVANQYKAFELYKKLANKGDLNAMVQLSDYYEQGIWTKKDTKKARQLLQQASDKGSLAAKWQLEFLESEK